MGQGQPFGTPNYTKKKIDELERALKYQVDDTCDKQGLYVGATSVADKTKFTFSIFLDKPLDNKVTSVSCTPGIGWVRGNGLIGASVTDYTLEIISETCLQMTLTLDVFSGTLTGGEIYGVYCQTLLITFE